MGFFSEYREVNKLLQQKQPVLFYAESRHYYAYFQKLLTDLVAAKIPVCYVTSDKKDALLSQPPDGVQVVYVKWMLGLFFQRVQADVFIMTMPDLGNYLFKRSSGVGKYIYVFHAAVSVHQQYNKAAFFNYDTIFCTGDYQNKEIRAMEKLYQQPEKELMNYGYPLFDMLREQATGSGGAIKTILIAPSWFNGCIFDTCLNELLTKLSVLPYQVIIRSHPEYEKRRKKDFHRVVAMTKKYSNMSIDTMPSINDRLPKVDVLITDRSGIAFEFALGVGKPILFIDTKLKQTNSEWERLNIEPIENSLREHLGITMLPSEIHQLESKLNEIRKREIGFVVEMDLLRGKYFYNSSESYRGGVEIIRKELD